MELGLQGNVALVVASSSGLGKASAKALAREGVDVVINGRDSDKLDEAVDEVNQIGNGEVIRQVGDITNPDDVRELVDVTIEEFGGLDHLVTSAGGPPSASFLDLTDEQWYDAYDLLVMSAVRLCRYSASHLRADTGGTIVHITSRAVKEAIEQNVLTGAVRMAVAGLAKTLSRELSPDVRVNTVLPGPFETQRYRNLLEQKVTRGEYDTYDQALEAQARRIPLERLGDPIELGNTVAFLCAERFGFINGSTILVDGGRTRATL